jgi:protocatechuate 3,4-dioxygenase beta subunit
MMRVLCILLFVACNGKQPPPATQPPLAPQPPAAAQPRAGMPLELRVRLVNAAGEPARNLDARVYHTDAEGYYLKTAAGTEAGGEHARHTFTVRTDDTGRFVLRTILPAPYPTGGPPAHIHLHAPPDSPDDLTIMLDHDPKLDRGHVAKMARTWIGRVRVEGDLAICDAEITTASSAR